MNKLAKQKKVQFTNDIEKALSILDSKGVCRAKFIRQAVEEKLYRDFRKILKDIEKENKKVYIPF
jgi:hypothetical protein